MGSAAEPGPVREPAPGSLVGVDIADIRLVDSLAFVEDNRAADILAGNPAAMDILELPEDILEAVEDSPVAVADSLPEPDMAEVAAEQELLQVPEAVEEGAVAAVVPPRVWPLSVRAWLNQNRLLASARRVS